MTRWIFVSDLQLRPDDAEHEERRRLLIERVAAEKPDFVIDGGDIVFIRHLEVQKMKGRKMSGWNFKILHTS